MQWRPMQMIWKRYVSTSKTNKSFVSSFIPATSNGLLVSSDHWKRQLQIVHELSKTKLSALVVMTTGAGFFMAGGPIEWGTFTGAVVGTSLAAASANTFNQVYEQKRDALMTRTSQRPLPSGRISTRGAMAWGISTGVTSTALLAATCNPLTAALGASNIALYSLVYTPLKAHSEINTWVGSLVGAIPPLMGWAAATNTLLSPEAALVSSLLYLWQFPHFFALSYRLRKDYARGGFKMVSVADPTGKRTASLVQRYCAYLAPLPILASVSGVTSWMFALEGSVVNAYVLYQARQFSKKPNDAHAKNIFLTSLWYLPLLLGGMVFHNENWHKGRVTGDNPSRWDVPTLVIDLREQLKQVCMHEKLWSGKSTVDSSLFCPVTVTEGVVKQTVDTVEDAVDNTTTPSCAGLF